MAIGVVILAAGQSKRMGVPKLLLPWKQHSIIEEAIEAVERVDWNHKDRSTQEYVNVYKVMVVGPCSEKLVKIAKNHNFAIVVNQNPSLGQGESLRLGVEMVVQESNKIGSKDVLEGILCLVGDQPFITEQIIHNILGRFYAAKNSRKSIVVPLYGRNRSIGNPVLFGAYWIADLCQIKGDMGGRSIIRGVGADNVVHTYESTEIQGIHQGFDIDTKEEYEAAYIIGGKG